MLAPRSPVVPILPFSHLTLWSRTAERTMAARRPSSYDSQATQTSPDEDDDSGQEKQEGRGHASRRDYLSPPEDRRKETHLSPHRHHRSHSRRSPHRHHSLRSSRSPFRQHHCPHCHKHKGSHSPREDRSPSGRQNPDERHYGDRLSPGDFSENDRHSLAGRRHSSIANPDAECQARRHSPVRRHSSDSTYSRGFFSSMLSLFKGQASTGPPDK